MPVLHPDQRARKPQRVRGLAWLLVLPALLLAALLLPVFARVEVRVNGEEWGATNTWDHARPQGAASGRMIYADGSGYVNVWALKLGDCYYEVYHSDVYTSGPTTPSGGKPGKPGIRLYPYGK